MRYAPPAPVNEPVRGDAPGSPERATLVPATDYRYPFLEPDA